MKSFVVVGSGNLDACARAGVEAQPHGLALALWEAKIPLTVLNPPRAMILAGEKVED